LEGLEYQGVTGRLSFDQQHNPQKEVIILVIEGGQSTYAGTAALP